jgi:hypothetical protein
MGVFGYREFQIETFEAGRGLWHARALRADGEPILLDGTPFPEIHVGICWPALEQALLDAQAFLERIGSRLTLDWAQHGRPRTASCLSNSDCHVSASNRPPSGSWGDAMTITAKDLDHISTDELWELHRRVASALERRLLEEINKLQSRLHRLSRARWRRSRSSEHEHPSHTGK